MGAPRVFAGMFGTLLTFAVATYLISGSFATTLWETIASAILLQVGYFLLVVGMVWRNSQARRSLRELDLPGRAVEAIAEEAAVSLEASSRIKPV
jgi:exopolysaccharide production repressor protein